MPAGFIPRLARVLAFIAVGPLIPAGAASADPLSDGRFRDEVVALVRTLQPAAEILPDPDPAQIRIGNRTIALTNLYPRVARLTGPERRKQIAAYLATGLRSGCCDETPGFAAVKARLRVQLLPRAMLKTLPVLAHRLFSDTLIVVYVLDEADRYRYVTASMLAAWNIDVPAIEALAVANLAAASKDAAFSLALADGAPMFVLVETGDNYDAARLLLPRYLEQIRSALKAEGVTLAAPTRDRLMAWPADSPARREFASEAQADADAGPYGRSAELFHLDRDGLRPLNAVERADHGR